MRKVLVLIGVLAVALTLAATAAADGKGPHAGTFGPAVCDSGTYAVVVSPSDGSHNGQVVGLNVNIVGLQITVTDTATGEVLFQSNQTGTTHNPQAQHCTIDGGGITLTLWALVTPR